MVLGPRYTDSNLVIWDRTLKWGSKGQFPTFNKILSYQSHSKYLQTSGKNYIMKVFKKKTTLKLTYYKYRSIR